MCISLSLYIYIYINLSLYLYLYLYLSLSLYIYIYIYIVFTLIIIIHIKEAFLLTLPNETSLIIREIVGNRPRPPNQLRNETDPKPLSTGTKSTGTKSTDYNYPDPNQLWNETNSGTKRTPNQLKNETDPKAMSTTQAFGDIGPPPRRNGSSGQAKFRS